MAQNLGKGNCIIPEEGQAACCDPRSLTSHLEDLFNQYRIFLKVVTVINIHTNFVFPKPSVFNLGQTFISNSPGILQKTK